jgi:MFS family permease
VNRNLRVLGIATAGRMLGNALYFPFLALFVQTVMGIGYVTIGVLIVATGIVQLPFNYAGGLLTDRIGRRRLILIGLAAECVTTLFLGYSFAARSLAGAIIAASIGGAILSAAGPAASAYVSDFAEGSERTRGFTFQRIGFNAGYSAGVTLGGLLIGVVGFAGSVGIAGIIIGGVAVLAALLLDPSPWDVAHAALGRRPNGQDSRGTPPNSRGLGESLRILTRDRIALELSVAVVCASLVVGQWAVVFPLYVHNILGISYALLGIGLALNGLVVVFGQTATTESVIGWRHTTIANVGLLLYAIGFLGLGAAGWLGIVPVVVFFLSVVVLTVGENLVTIPHSTLPSNIAPAGEVGSYNGAFSTFGAAGFFFSVLLGTWVLAETANPLLIWVILVIPALPAMVLFRHAAGNLRPELDRA